MSVDIGTFSWEAARHVLTDECMTTDSKARGILIMAEMRGTDKRVVGYGELTTTHNKTDNTFTLSMREL
jgi:hypothetical protein